MKYTKKCIYKASKYLNNVGLYIQRYAKIMRMWSLGVKNCFYCKCKLRPETFNLDHLVLKMAFEDNREEGVLFSCIRCDRKPLSAKYIAWLKSEQTL